MIMATLAVDMQYFEMHFLPYMSEPYSNNPRRRVMFDTSSEITLIQAEVVSLGVSIMTLFLGFLLFLKAEIGG